MLRLALPLPWFETETLVSLPPLQLQLLPQQWLPLRERQFPLPLRLRPWLLVSEQHHCRYEYTCLTHLFDPDQLWLLSARRYSYYESETPLLYLPTLNQLTFGDPYAPLGYHYLFEDLLQLLATAGPLDPRESYQRTALGHRFIPSVLLGVLDEYNQRQDYRQPFPQYCQQLSAQLDTADSDDYDMLQLLFYRDTYCDPTIVELTEQQHWRQQCLSPELQQLSAIYQQQLPSLVAAGFQLPPWYLGEPITIDLWWCVLEAAAALPYTDYVLTLYPQAATPNWQLWADYQWLLYPGDSGTQLTWATNREYQLASSLSALLASWQGHWQGLPIKQLRYGRTYWQTCWLELTTDQGSNCWSWPEWLNWLLYPGWINYQSYQYLHPQPLRK